MNLNYTFVGKIIEFNSIMDLSMAEEMLGEDMKKANMWQKYGNQLRFLCEVGDEYDRLIEGFKEYHIAYSVKNIRLSNAHSLHKYFHETVFPIFA